MAESIKQVLHVDSAKSFGASEGRENERRWDDDKYAKKNQDPDNHYDKSRRNLNFEIGPDGQIYPLGYRKKPLEERLQDRLKELGWHPFKEGCKNQPNMVAKFIFGGNHDRTLEMAFGDQPVNLEKSPPADNSHLQRMPEIEQWAMDVYKWLCKRFGKENIIGLEVHLDEHSPHIHALVVPVGVRKKSGRPFVSWSSKFGKDGTSYGNILREMHTSFYEEVGQKYRLERGDSVVGRNVKHLSKKKYLEQLEREIIQKEKALKGLTSMIVNAEKTIAVQRELIEQLKLDVASGKISAEEARLKIDAAQRTIEEKEQVIKDKNSKIDSANVELDTLTRNVETVRQIMTPYRNPKPDVSPPRIEGKPKLLQSFENWKQEQDKAIASSFWDSINHVLKVVMSDAERRIKAVSDNALMDYSNYRYLLEHNGEQEARANGLEEDLSILIDQLIHAPVRNLLLSMTAALLDGSVPPSSGGGGSSSDLRWDGRRLDEDKEQYHRRCLLFASKYIHSSMSRRSSNLKR